MQTSINTTRKQVCTFANQIKRWNPDLTISECFIYAWSEIPLLESAEAVTFYKVKSEAPSSYLVYKNWLDYYTPKGNGNGSSNPDRILLVDVARLQSGAKNVIISTYKSRML